MPQETKDKLGKWISSGFVIFAVKKVHDEKEINQYKVTEDGTEYNIWIKRTAKVDLVDLWSKSENPQKALQFLNILIKDLMRKMKFSEMGRLAKYFDISTCRDINQNLSIVSGCTTTVQFLGGQPRLLIDFNTRLFRRDTCYEFIQNLYRGGYKNGEIARKLVGRSVLAKYGNNRFYRIDGVEEGKKITDTIEGSSPPITYFDYYKSRYGITIRNSKQPLLIHRNRRTDQDIHLVPELCHMTGIEDRDRNDFHLMKEIAKHTKLAPDQRRQKIMEFKEKIGAEAMKEWSLKIEEKPDTTGYVLQQPKIKYDNGSVTPRLGQFNATNPIYGDGQLKNWIIVGEDKKLC